MSGVPQSGIAPAARIPSIPVAVPTPEGLELSSRGRRARVSCPPPTDAAPFISTTPQGSNRSAPTGAGTFFRCTVTAACEPSRSIKRHIGTQTAAPAITPGKTCLARAIQSAARAIRYRREAFVPLLRAACPRKSPPPIARPTGEAGSGLDPAWELLCT